MRLRILIALGLTAGLASCASISEDTCQAGAWADYGYKDGLNGRSSGRIAKYAKTCSEYGITPDSTAYLTAYDAGIVKYCTYERGFERGEDGSSYNQACSGPLATDFAPGYDAGRAVYEIRKEHNDLVERYYDTEDALIEVRRRLREDDLDADETRRLEKKARRLRDRKDDIRIDIRTLERLHGLPRYRFH